MRIALIIPAHNEERRLPATLRAYNTYFNGKDGRLVDFIVVSNASSDGTVSYVKQLQQSMPNLFLVDIPQGGKGIALIHGFTYALHDAYDYIGFVDADMATSPQAFDDLIKNINGYDGIIASRYMQGAIISPARPWIKRWGSRIFYESFVKLLFGLHYHDTQCGAKLFKKDVIARIISYLHVQQWAIDVELLYLCKQFGFSIKEYPTVWNDQKDSKLRVFSSGLRMPLTLFLLRWHYFGKVLFFLFFVCMFNSKR